MTAPRPNRSRAGRTQRVTEEMRGRIARGALAPGARLPSVRSCAVTLGVSPSTVVGAYERLVAEGEITARRGAGFFVAHRARPLSLAEADPPAEREIDPLWVMHQSLEAAEGALTPGCGWLPESWMPADAIRRALRAEARGPDAPLVTYGRPLGFAPLREHLSRRLRERVIAAGPEQVLLTDSGTQAIDLLCRLFVRAGDAVVVDDPCYFNFLNVLRAHGARIVGVPYTERGPDLDALARVLAQHRPRLYLTTGALHNPTGATPAPSALHRVLKLAEAHDLVVVEDDVFADLEPEPTPRLASFDGLERAAYVGSCSKTLSASVRSGFIAARPDWIAALADLKLAATFGSSDLAARVVHRLLVDGSYRRHVEGLQGKLSRARAETARRLAACGLRLWAEPRGGLFLWAELPAGVGAAEVSRRAMREGVVLAPGDAFSVGRGAGGFFRFNASQCAEPRVFEVLRAAMDG